MAHWAVVPAAGSGTRMNAAIPKQYLPLAGKPILEHTLHRLASHPRIDGIAVALAPNDTRWDALNFTSTKPLLVARGGDERCHSVLNALHVVAAQAGDDAWVLVHDGARPCVRHADISRLIEQASAHPVGGLLAAPVRDTMKRSDVNGDVYETVDRKGLWHAYTPQMFRLGLLREALMRALDRGMLVTDEAAAIELAGHKPHLVEGATDNIKITRPEDLVVAEFFLMQQGNKH